MKILIIACKVLIILMILILMVFILGLLASGHNVPQKTYNTIGCCIAFLIVLYIVVAIFEKKYNK